MEKTKDQIINKVAASSLITFDLEQYYRTGDRLLFDIKDYLFQGLILREKDFRDFIKGHDWQQYRNKFVAIHCSVDAIVPTWAYMLLAIALQPYASQVTFGSLEELEIAIFKESFSKLDWSEFKDAKVVLKGCSKVSVPVAVYVEVTNNLKPYVSSLMFGEPCSTVPLFKKAKV